MQGRAWLLRPGSLALCLSVLIHGGIVAVALWAVQGVRPAVPRGLFEVDTVAFLLDDPAPADAEESEAGEQRSEDFHFAAPGPEEPATVETPIATIPASGGTDVPGSGGSGPGLARRGTGPALFREADAARTVVYVIDRSISMGLRGALEAAKQELLDSVARLPETARFQVIFYNRDAQPLAINGQRGLLPASEEVRRAVALAVEEVPAEGSTNHVSALRQALLLEPEVICLVTDADDMTADQVRTVTQINHGRAAIHAVQLGTNRASPSDGALRNLAQANRGTYRTVEIREELPH